MIDHLREFENAVKNELAEACRAQGIDKTLAGYVITPPWPAPVPTTEGVAMIPSWLLTVTLRVTLLGQPPAASSTLLPGPVPQAAMIRQAVRELLKAADAERRERESVIPAAA